MANVGKAIDEIRAVMRIDWYMPASYRFILQSYPSAIPRGSEIRVSESDKVSRTSVDGCPFYNTDATWARDSVVNQIARLTITGPSERGTGPRVIAVFMAWAWPRPR